MRIRIHPTLYVYLLCIAVLSSYQTCLGMLIALLMHEAWHYIAGRLVGEQIEQLELTPLGGIMQYKRGTVSHKGLRGVFVHAAGPLGNYVCLLSTGIPIIQKTINPELLRSLILCNVSMLILNLLPVLPLDGGHIVFCLGYYLFPIAQLASCLSVLGMIAGIGGLLLFGYGLMIHQLLNCSLLIISLYLLVCARQSRRNLLTENIYAIVQERLTEPARIRRIEHYQVNSDVLLFELVPLLRQGISIVFSFVEGNQDIELTEYAFCRALLTMPTATVREACQNFMQCKEKSACTPQNARFPS